MDSSRTVPRSADQPTYATLSRAFDIRSPKQLKSFSKVRSSPCLSDPCPCHRSDTPLLPSSQRAHVRFAEYLVADRPAPPPHPPICPAPASQSYSTVPVTRHPPKSPTQAPHLVSFPAIPSGQTPLHSSRADIPPHPRSEEHTSELQS